MFHFRQEIKRKRWKLNHEKEKWFSIFIDKYYVV